MKPIDWGPAIVVALSYLAAALWQNKRIDDLKDFIRSEIKRVEDRIERLERPVLRP